MEDHDHNEDDGLSDCDICGNDMNRVDATPVQCERCLRVGCDRCTQRRGQEMEDGEYEEYILCDDCFFTVEPNA